jgi:hypothetical protein
MIPRELVVPYAASMAIAVALLAAALKWPRAARIIIGVGFCAAGVFNTVTVLRHPEAYLFYATHAVEAYRQIITGPFAAHPRACVIAIAAGQAAAGVLLLTARGARWGAAGAIVFLLAIAPLGVGSAFPSTLIIAGAVSVSVFHGRSGYGKLGSTSTGSEAARSRAAASEDGGVR